MSTAQYVGQRTVKGIEAGRIVIDMSREEAIVLLDALGSATPGNADFLKSLSDAINQAVCAGGRRTGTFTKKGLVIR